MGRGRPRRRPDVLHAALRERGGDYEHRTRTVDGFVPTGFVPTGIAFSPDGNTVYVGNQDATVSVIDVASRQVTATYVASGAILNRVTVGHAVNAFAVARDNRILYVSAFADGTVTELDIYTKRTLSTFAVGGTPQGVAVNRRGTRLYVANEQGYLNDIDLRTGVSEPPIPLAGGGFGVGVTPDDNQAYITIPAPALCRSSACRIAGLPERSGWTAIPAESPSAAPAWSAPSPMRRAI